MDWPYESQLKLTRQHSSHKQGQCKHSILCVPKQNLCPLLQVGEHINPYAIKEKM